MKIILKIKILWKRTIGKECEFITIINKRKLISRPYCEKRTTIWPTPMNIARENVRKEGNMTNTNLLASKLMKMVQYNND